MALDGALDGLKVDHARMQQTADDLMAIVSAIDARLHDLERELGPLRASWVGEAQEAYAAAKRRWDTAIAEMRDLLHRTSQLVTSADGEYRRADARGARSFES